MTGTFGALGLATGCRCSGAPAPDAALTPLPEGEKAPVWHAHDFEPSEAYGEKERALVLVPEAARAPQDPSPIVVALHGRGESGRGLDAGAAGFRDDYLVDRIDRKLRAPPIMREDLLGYATDERIAKWNASLKSAPYRGVVLACPYAPDLKDKSPGGARAYGRFIAEALVPTVRNAYAPQVGPERTGLDGISMGGRLALWIGLQFPEIFASVGAIQPALRAEDAPTVVALAKAARAKRPGLFLRLASSEDDPFLRAVEVTSEALKKAGISHDLVVVPGPHSYDFNRGPGAVELLGWHERVLRGLAPP